MADLLCRQKRVKCDVCGRPVIIRSGRGSKKQRHRQCTNLDSGTNVVERLAKITVWEDAEHVAKFRKRLFQIICNAFNQKGAIIFRPDDDREPEIIIAEIGGHQD